MTEHRHSHACRGRETHADAPQRVDSAGGVDSGDSGNCQECGHYAHVDPVTVGRGVPAKLLPCTLCACGIAERFNSCAMCRHNAHPDGECTGMVTGGGVISDCACTLRKVTPYVEASMQARYGDSWRYVMGQEMSASVRARLREVLRDGLRNCATWKPAGVEVEALEGQLRALDWLLSDDANPDARIVR